MLMQFLSLSSPMKGTIIHVTGNPATGFTFSSRATTVWPRNYAATKSSLADTDNQYIRGTPGGKETEDTTARDRLESATSQSLWSINMAFKTHRLISLLIDLLCTKLPRLDEELPPTPFTE
ncbi:hypothetical protein N7457_007882 [Penicillium paradoxum]|uniref:uncharacterized protein n=1 Tax=Penicillium paradoxum TaxID=176176 RepID=UPI0025481702|nr:uncharacterized protein N7457_007882 [Penicillium paradoxum]KAJ5772986.1 hypothetical protein N7457_007882 [Penicillium paradoxum]